MSGASSYRGFGLRRFNFDIGGRWTVLTGVIALSCAILLMYGYANRTPEEVRQALPTQSYKSFALYETLALSQPAFLKMELWRFVSSVFLHENVMQLVCTILILYLFGSYLTHRLRTLLFFLSFLVSGIAGGIVSLILSPQAICLCAPAASLGIATLCVLYFPYLRFLRIFTAKQLLVLAVALMLLSSATFTSEDIRLLAQLGGPAAAFVLYRLEPNIRLVMTRRRLRREITLVYSEAQKEEELDRILKKVSISGMDSLTHPERRFLQTMSSKYQKKKIKQD